MSWLWVLAGCRPDEAPPIDGSTVPEGCVPDAEVCNGIDDDCDGETDEEGGPARFEDQDGDGIGAGAADIACGAVGAPEGTDCDDDDPAVHPGAPEVWYDGVDSDCSGGSDLDQDGDGEEAVELGGTDCRDRAPGIDSDRCDNLLLLQGGHLIELGADGSVVRDEPLADPVRGPLAGRGVQVTADGMVLVLGQTLAGELVLATWDGATWSSVSGPPEWTLSIDVHGTFAVDGDVAWLPDEANNDAGGLIVADLETGTLSRAAGGSYREIALGGDGWLYAMSYEATDRIDPVTFALGEPFAFPPGSEYRAFAVTADGTMYAADWYANVLVAYDADGAELDRLRLNLIGPSSLDLRSDGRIAVTGRFGDIRITDTTMTAVASFPAVREPTSSFVEWIAP